MTPIGKTSVYTGRNSIIDLMLMLRYVTLRSIIPRIAIICDPTNGCPTILHDNSYIMNCAYKKKSNVLHQRRIDVAMLQSKITLSVTAFRGLLRTVYVKTNDGGRDRTTSQQHYDPAFEISVVRAPGTTKKIAGQPKILMQLSDGQP